MTPPRPLKRKVAAGAAMLGSAGIMAWESLHHWRVEWIPFAFSGILAASAVGITRKSLAPQILSRGAAWITLFFTGLAVAISVLRGHVPGLEESALAATSAAALWLSSPMLRTKEALAAFAPKAYRRILLAGSTATVATAYLTGGIALESFHDSKGLAIPFAALTVSLLASAVGVVRMRAWGVLLGGLTSISLLIAALFAGASWGSLLAFCAAPMLALHALPILLARAGFGQKSATARVATDEAEPARYRVAVDEELELDEPEPAFRHAVLRSP